MGPQISNICPIFLSLDISLTIIILMVRVLSFFRNRFIFLIFGYLNPKHIKYQLISLCVIALISLQLECEVLSYYCYFDFNTTYQMLIKYKGNVSNFGQIIIRTEMLEIYMKNFRDLHR